MTPIFAEAVVQSASRPWPYRGEPLFVLGVVVIEILCLLLLFKVFQAMEK